MYKRVGKLFFFIMYLLAAGLISYFLPDYLKCAFGFVIGLIAVWAWKVLIANSPTEDLTIDELKELRDFANSQLESLKEEEVHHG